MPNLASHKTCTGCAACSNICPTDAISISPDSEGFLFPKIDENKCIECKLCEKACPLVNGKDFKNPETQTAYAFWDNKTRTESSSGGAFSAIARWIIERNGIVFGAAWTSDFKCGHIGCNSMDELYKLRGSKYLQSDIGSTFKEVRDILKTGRFVLFTGTPCQIGGLKSFLMKDYDNLVTVEIVCHGVPSNNLFCNYINKLKTENKKYKSASGFQFRKLNKWGFSSSLLFSDNNRKTINGIDDLFMAAFDKAALFRESCYDCHFNGLKRVSDISIADFWGLGKLGKPFKQDVSKGVSLILVNNQKGKEIIEDLEDCFKEERTIEEATKNNHNILFSSVRPAMRESIIDAFNSSRRSLADINSEFRLVGSGLSSKIRIILIKLNLFWTVKSIINKFRSL